MGIIVFIDWIDTGVVLLLYLPGGLVVLQVAGAFAS